MFKNQALRVSVYCRVSTDKEDQANSLESQKKYFSEYIDKNPLWRLVKVYVDEGVTGTSTKKRFQFNQMIEDAEKHDFDLIVTKEISRFARNTLDSIFYTRLLKSFGVGVLFVNDNINTLDSDAELRLTIMSSIAQEESRKTSDRVKWGQKRRMEQGVVFGRDMLGYDVSEGKLIVNEIGANAVRLIFHKFVNEGKGTHVIARELCQQCVPVSAHMKQWSNTAVLRVLRNEKYCGDLVQKKTFTPDYLTHQKKYNHGEEDLVILTNHHTAIVPRDMFNRAQQELEKRSPKGIHKEKYTNRYCFSGKIKCADCGKTYVSRMRKRKDGTASHSWRCSATAKNGNIHIDKTGNLAGCNNVTIANEKLKSFAMQAIKEMPVNKEKLAKNLIDLISSVLVRNQKLLSEDKLTEQIDKLTEKRKRLIELYINCEISKSDFENISVRYKSEILNLENLKNEIDREKSSDNVNDRLEKMECEISKLLQGDVWDDVFYRQIIDTILVSGNNTVSVQLAHFSKQFFYCINK